MYESAATPSTTRTFSVTIIDRNTGYPILAPVHRTYTIQSEQGAAALESTRYLLMRAESLYSKEIEERIYREEELREFLKPFYWKISATLVNEDSSHAPA